MTVNLNEITHLVQQLEAIIDDSEGEVVDIRISENKTAIFLWYDLFTDKFNDFDVRINLGDRYHYKLSVNKDGVNFFTVISDVEFEDLMDVKPNKYKKIQAILVEKLLTERNIKNVIQG